MFSRKGAFAILALIVVGGLSAGLIVFFSSASASAKYDKISKGMSLVDVEAAVGERGLEKQPGDTTGVYQFVRSEDYAGPDEDKSPQVERFWVFGDGMITASFNKDGRITKKMFLKR